MTDILITSSVLIAAVFAVRFAFRKTLSCRIRYALWGLVLLRLLLPVQLPAADFSVLSRVQPIRARIVRSVETARFMDTEVLPAAPDDMPPFVENTGENAAISLNAGTLAASEWLPLVWIAGMTATGSAFLLFNLRFRYFLHRNRKRCRDRSASRAVYSIDAGLVSPCLFGLFRSAIYLTPAAAAPERLRHVIAHEETHARHGDPLWSFLRCICLTIYWFDPLVWAAAFASKTDCELACDEGTLARLEESERIAYGETLLSLISTRQGNPFLTATTMSAGKRQLRDRISRIAKRPRHFTAVTLCVVLIAVIVCACTFAGERPGSDFPDSAEQGANIIAPSTGSDGFQRESVRDQDHLALPTLDGHRENFKWEEEIAIAEAQKILSRAFAYDAAAIPDISHENAQGKESITLTFRDQENESDFYTVTFADSVPYPMTAYHFHGYSDREEADIANNTNFSYNTDMTQAAKDFVKNVCGVDCSMDTVSAYGYRNKVCVLLIHSETEVFLVSFHYTDLHPAGVRLAPNYAAALHTMELEKGQLVYTEMIERKQVEEKPAYFAHFLTR